MNISTRLFIPRPPLLRGTYSLSMSPLMWKLPDDVSIFLVLMSICSNSSFVQLRIPIVGMITGMANMLCYCFIVTK